MAKVVGCVLLDHCVVEDGQVYLFPPQWILNGELNSRAKLEGCIFGKNTKVGSKAEVVRCITQAGYEISAGGERIPPALPCHGLIWFSYAENVKNEKLDVSDWTAALDETEDDESDEDEDEEEDEDESDE